MKQNQRDTNNPSSQADNGKGGRSQQTAGSNQTTNPKRAGEANEGPIVAGNEKKSASSNANQGGSSNPSPTAKSQNEKR